LNYYGFTQEEKEKYKKQLYDAKDVYSHFHLDVLKLTFELVTLPFTPLEEGGGNSSRKKKKGRGGGNTNNQMELFQGRRVTKRDALVLSNAHRFLGEKLVRNSRKAIALFELVFSCLPKNLINPKNLTMTLKKKGAKTGRSSKVTVSLIDYCSVLTNTHAVPSELISQFHQYLIREHQITLPTAFITNKRFW
jgi:hypothetical protein